MKLRQGFVSNSSSSSFLIGIENPDSSIAKFLQARVDVYQEYKSYRGLRGESLVQEREQDYGDDADDEDKKLFAAMRAYGDNLVYLSFDWGDEDMPEIISWATKKGDIKVLQGD